MEWIGWPIIGLVLVLLRTKVQPEGWARSFPQLRQMPQDDNDVPTAYLPDSPSFVSWNQTCLSKRNLDLHC
jgi:hypothetical protein